MDLVYQLLHFIKWDRDNYEAIPIVVAVHILAFFPLLSFAWLTSLILESFIKNL